MDHDLVIKNLEAAHKALKAKPKDGMVSAPDPERRKKIMDLILAILKTAIPILVG